MADAAGNQSTAGAAYTATVDTQAPAILEYNTRVAGGGGYWYTTVGAYVSALMPTVMGGTTLGFSVWTAGDVASIDWTITGGYSGTVTSGNNGVYWDFQITVPNASVSGGRVDFVFRDAVGNGASTADTAGNTKYFDITVNASPLVLDLTGDGVRTTGAQNGVLFDVFATGQPARMGWTDGRDGLLVLDLNHDGKINDGKELFGTGTDTPRGKASDGFAALAQYDTNGDGVIDAQDAVFSQLQVWVDANVDGITDTGELQGLADLGISSLALQSARGQQYEQGNLLGLVSNWTDSAGQVHELTDVYFNTSSLQAWVEQARQKIDMATDPAANVQALRLADVLATEQRTLVVKAGGNDVVQVEQTLWSSVGLEVSVAEDVYELWVHAGAALWIDKNASVQQVL